MCEKRKKPYNSVSQTKREQESERCNVDRQCRIWIIKERERNMPGNMQSTQNETHAIAKLQAKETTSYRIEHQCDNIKHGTLICP
jgi:hypothetical protein